MSVFSKIFVDNNNKDSGSLKKIIYSENNVLLTDYSFVYNNVESIFINHRYTYKVTQGYEQYYIFFSCLTKKYNIDEEYNYYLNNEMSLSILKSNWKDFAIRLLEFIGSAPKDILNKLLKNEEVIKYFIKYNDIYDMKLLTNLGIVGYNILLENNYICRHYLYKPDDIFNIKIKESIMPKIPSYVFEDSNVIKTISSNSNIEEFYYRYNWIYSKFGLYEYMEEHKKYIDNQVLNTKLGILPSEYDEYREEPKIMVDNKKMDTLRNQIIHRIFFKNNTDYLSKKYVYQNLSKYIIVWMFISRFYETSPYNLLLDIKELYEYSTRNNIDLKGMEVYSFLAHYEDKTIYDVIKLYRKYLNSDINLMEILYDDWNNQKKYFIENLNSRLINFNNIIYNKINSYYDITDNNDYILVHNTSIPVSNIGKIIEIYNNLINGEKKYICLSLQDRKHQMSFDKRDKDSKTVKFLFGKLDENRVGIISHRDASTIDVDRVSDYTEYRGRLYTLDEFMKETYNYNEICYLTSGICFKPIGILVDNYITEEEVYISNLLCLPLVFRNKCLNNRKDYVEKIYRKKYNSNYTCLKLF